MGQHNIAILSQYKLRHISASSLRNMHMYTMLTVMNIE